MTVYFTLICVICVSGVRGEVTTVSVKEGQSVTLHTGVTRPQHEPVRWYFNNILIALINEDPSKSCLYDGEGGIFRDRLKVDFQTGSLTITDIRSEHTGRYEAKHIGGESSGKTQSLNRNRKCDSTKIDRKTSSTDDIIKTFSVTVSESGMERKGQQDPGKITGSGPSSSVPGSGPSSSVPGSGLSSGAVAGISVIGVLLVFAASGVIYYRRRRSRNGL